MAIRSTYSSRAVLEQIRDAINLIPASVATGAGNTVAVLDEVNEELRKTRVGHELHLWGQEVEETDEED